MIIKTLNKVDLDSFIQSTAFEKLENIPISVHRAQSQIKNPRSGADDTLLLVAYIDEKLVGYLGALPDKIFYNNQLEKMAWLSCLWVDKNYRGKKIAYKLVEKALEVWENKILLTDYTAISGLLYLKLGKFNILKEKKGVRIFARFDLQHILLSKHRFFKKIVPLIQLADMLANALLDFRFLFYSKKLKNFALEEVTNIDSQIEHFIVENQAKNLFKRSAEEINWIMKNPWILPHTENKKEQNYYFSDFDDSFSFHSFKVLDNNNKMIAFLTFAKRNDNLKLQFCYTETSYDVIRKVVNHLIVKWKIKTFTSFDDKLSTEIMQGKTPGIYKKTLQRDYMISKYFDLKLLPEGFEIQAGDADCVFT